MKLLLLLLLLLLRLRIDKVSLIGKIGLIMLND